MVRSPAEPAQLPGPWGVTEGLGEGCEPGGSRQAQPSDRDSGVCAVYSLSLSPGDYTALDGVSFSAHSHTGQLDNVLSLAG